MEQRLALAAEARRAVRHNTAALSQADFLAQVRLLVEAKLAGLALRRVKRNDMIADLEVGYALADRLYNTGSFVTFNLIKTLSYLVKSPDDLRFSYRECMGRDLQGRCQRACKHRCGTRSESS